MPLTVPDIMHGKKVPIENDLPLEPDLSEYLGYDDCSTCYFRVTTLNRIKNNVKNLKKGA